MTIEIRQSNRSLCIISNGLCMNVGNSVTYMLFKFPEIPLCRLGCSAS